MDSGPIAASGQGRLVGQSVTRKEDDRLLRGEGRYTDDVTFPGQAVGYFVRSPYAHGVIKRLDTSAAANVPGVIGCVTANDLKAAGYGPLPCKLPLKSHLGTPLIVPERLLLADERVRFVGEPVALVVAESLSAAKDGAEAIILDVEPLPGVSDASEAVRDGAPQLFEEAPGNVCLDWRFGDFAAIDAALAGAAHVTRLDMVNNRKHDPARGINARLKKAAFANGLICYPMGGTLDGISGDHVLLAPPFIVEDGQIDEIVEKLDRSFRAIF